VLLTATAARRSNDRQRYTGIAPEQLLEATGMPSRSARDIAAAKTSSE